MRSFQSQPEQGVGEPRVKRPAEERGRIVMREGKPRPLFFTGKRPKRDRHSRRKVSFFHFRNYEPAFKYFTEQVLDADYIAIETLQGGLIGTRPYKGSHVDISTLRDGFYVLKSLNGKGITHRLGLFAIRRKAESQRP